MKSFMDQPLLYCIRYCMDNYCSYRSVPGSSFTPPTPKKPNGDRRFAKENKSGQYRRTGDSMPAVDSTRRIVELESGIQQLRLDLREANERILKLESRRPRFGWRR